MLWNILDLEALTNGPTPPHDVPRTLRREWTGLDKYRLDKYYSFMRLMLREVLLVVAKQRYNADWIQRALFPMEAEVQTHMTPLADVSLCFKLNIALLENSRAHSEGTRGVRAEDVFLHVTLGTLNQWVKIGELSSLPTV